MALRIKKTSLADKINSLVSTAPTNFDSDDDADDTRAKVVDQDDESDNSDSNFQVSEIRRQNVDLLEQLDERYKGKKISRKDIYSVDNDSINTTDYDEEDEINSLENNEKESSNDENTDDEDYDSNENHDFTEGEIDDNESTESRVKEKNDENVNVKKKTNFQTISHTNLRADIEKGSCIINQLKLWESLLEVRIKLQKCLVTSNQMPQYDIYTNFKENVEYMKKVNESRNGLKKLLNNMLQLQTVLSKQYPETMNLSSQNRKRKAEENIDSEIINSDDAMDEEILSDSDNDNDTDDKLVSDEDTEHNTKNMFNMELKLNNYEKLINESYTSYRNYRNSVIQKWNEKTKLVSGKLNKDTNQTTLKQIEFALSDKKKLQKRTQLKRSEYKIIGKVDSVDDNEGRRVQEYDPEIYDDDDFYHQLLRDLIEHKSADVTDPIQLSKQWIQLQNMRSKMKRKVDTRATKGRKIRYNVHNKLVNFMAPITVNDTWSDQAKDELYNSLFGKIKSINKHNVN
ncbi:apoptosis antagonizing transcription factor [Augochlora pura]